ncbi:hypothetical protein XENOCAPTIV_022905 [Xenoophorus captivus]|uniref:Secreted protein n=1 Tax=Xenoophorus captivus TaxID=1517983 RepID=A0ABV0S010_9TELE
MTFWSTVQASWWRLGLCTLSLYANRQKMTKQKLCRVFECGFLMLLFHWLISGGAAPLHSVSLHSVQYQLCFHLPAGAMAAEASPPAISVVRCGTIIVTVNSC